MKKVAVMAVVVLLLSLSPCCNAEEISSKDIYDSQYGASGLDEIDELLPTDAADEMRSIDISDLSFDWSETLSASNIFEHIFKYLKGGMKSPLTAGCSVLAILLMSAALGNFFEKNKMLDYAVTVGITAAIVLPVSSTVSVCISALKSSGIFMAAFVPVYAAILASRGKALTSAGFSAVMLTVSEAVSALCSFVIVPLSGIQLAIGICGSVVDDINISSLMKAVKRAAVWSLTLISTVFLGILGMQTLVASPADNLSSKTAKFLIGTSVPVIGNAVSEALATVRGCLKLLGSSAAVYAVIAVCVIILPVALELILWRITLLVLSSTAEMFAVDKAAVLLKTVDSVIAFLLGVLALVAVLFIISLTVVAVV